MEVPFYYDSTVEDVAVCPFNRYHIMLAHRLSRHIFKCHRHEMRRQEEGSSSTSGTYVPPKQQEPEAENWDHYNYGAYVPPTPETQKLKKEQDNNWRKENRDHWGRKYTEKSNGNQYKCGKYVPPPMRQYPKKDEEEENWDHYNCGTYVPPKQQNKWSSPLY